MTLEEMKQMLKEIEETLETQAPYFDGRLLDKERDLKRLIAKEE
tara:strand:+ start:438 stop:569 length:132 start_codon:yes stop_codon:yes gene_type:complete